MRSIRMAEGFDLKMAGAAKSAQDLRRSRRARPVDVLQECNRGRIAVSTDQCAERLEMRALGTEKSAGMKFGGK